MVGCTVKGVCFTPIFFEASSQGGERKLLSEFYDLCLSISDIVSKRSIYCIFETVLYLLASGIPALYLFRLSVHAGFPGISRHLWHGDEQQTNSTEKEQDKSRARTCKRPRIVIFDPDSVFTFYHPLD